LKNHEEGEKLGKRRLKSALKPIFKGCGGRIMKGSSRERNSFDAKSSGRGLKPLVIREGQRGGLINVEGLGANLSQNERYLRPPPGQEERRDTDMKMGLSCGIQFRS